MLAGVELAHIARRLLLRVGIRESRREARTRSRGPVRWGNGRPGPSGAAGVSRLDVPPSEPQTARTNGWFCVAQGERAIRQLGVRMVRLSDACCTRDFVPVRTQAFG